MPKDIEAMLMDRWLESSGEVESSLAKDVVGNETVVRVNRAVDDSVRWKRAFALFSQTLRESQTAQGRESRLPSQSLQMLLCSFVG